MKHQARTEKKRKKHPHLSFLFFASHSKWKLHVVVGRQFNRVRSLILVSLVYAMRDEMASWGFFLLLREWNGGFICPSYGMGWPKQPVVLLLLLLLLICVLFGMMLIDIAASVDRPCCFL
ncbi:hypothetical protein HDV63DRAFT_367884 [Trichoderma sp. SZMC 28014]